MTGFFYHPICLLHDNGPGHPECPDRLKAIHEHLEKSDLLRKVQRFEPQPAEIETLALVHPRDYIESLERHCAAAGNGRVRLDADTTVCKDSFAAACLALRTRLDVNPVFVSPGHLTFVSIQVNDPHQF